MGWKNIGARDVHTENGTHHESIQVKTDSMGWITDILRTPISDNPNTNHGHIWNLDKPNETGKRDPKKYG